MAGAAVKRTLDSVQMHHENSTFVVALEKERRKEAELILEMKEWHSLRRVAFRVIQAQHFDFAVGAIIFFNMLLVILETDCQAQDTGCSTKWIDTANIILLCVYCMELVTKLYVCRWRFWMDSWNLVDCVVVGCDLLLMLGSIVFGRLPSISILRVFRLIRLVRVLKAASYCQELRHLLLSLANALRACAWSMFLIVVLIVLYAIVAVQLVHPISKEVATMGAYSEDCVRCPHAYETVFKATLTFFQQCVMGDNWGETTLPIIEHSPWTAVIFVSVMITIYLAMLNLVVAVIVEASMECVWQDQHTQALEQELKMADAKKELLTRVIELDTEKTGAVTFEKFRDAFNTQQKFGDLLKTMDITEDDLGRVFQVVDSDGSGDVDYLEFVDQLYRLKCNSHQLVLFSLADMQGQLAELCSAAGIRSKRRRSSIPSSMRGSELSPSLEFFGGSHRKRDQSSTPQNGSASLLSTISASLSRSRTEILNSIKEFESSTSNYQRQIGDQRLAGIESVFLSAVNSDIQSPSIESRQNNSVHSCDRSPLAVLDGKQQARAAAQGEVRSI